MHTYFICTEPPPPCFPDQERRMTRVFKMVPGGSGGSKIDTPVHLKNLADGE